MEKTALLSISNPTSSGSMIFGQADILNKMELGLASLLRVE